MDLGTKRYPTCEGTPDTELWTVVEDGEQRLVRYAGVLGPVDEVDRDLVVKEEFHELTVNYNVD